MGKCGIAPFLLANLLFVSITNSTLSDEMRNAGWQVHPTGQARNAKGSVDFCYGCAEFAVIETISFLTLPVCRLTSWSQFATRPNLDSAQYEIDTT